MPNQDTRETFAIVRTDESDLDITPIARLLAEPLGFAVVDLVQTLGQGFGIFAEDLPAHIASQCVSLLGNAGVQVRMVPQSAIVEIPELLALRSGRPDIDVFFYVGLHRKGAVKWADLLWIDLVSVQEASTEEFDDGELSGDSEGAAVRRTKNHRLVTKRPLFVDLVISQPWLLLRIPQDRFARACTR